MPSLYYIPLLRSWPPVMAPLGDVTFTPSDATVTSYTGKVYISGTSTLVATQALGLPKPNAANICTVNMFATLSALTAGTYDVTITATSPGGSTESAVSNVFSVPLIPR